MKIEKTALVTGGSRGIGQSLATHLSKTYSNIITTASSAVSVQKAQEFYLSQNLNNIKVFELNLKDIKSIDGFLSQLKSLSISPDIVLNNAGITNDNISLKMSIEQWSSVIDVNLNGTFYLTKGLLRGMLKKRYGRVVFISSVVASMGNPGQANYCAAKAGLLGLMRSLSLEYASKGITINAISPGFIETDMTAELTDTQRRKMLENIPAGRFGETKHICHAADFLVSEDASYVTGQNIHVNGGLYIT